jgi:hypothetical protein
MKSGKLNFLEASGALQACNGTVLPLPFTSCMTSVETQTHSTHTSNVEFNLRRMRLVRL